MYVSDFVKLRVCYGSVSIPPNTERINNFFKFSN
jgi:hypothetical protein